MKPFRLMALLCALYIFAGCFKEDCTTTANNCTPLLQTKTKSVNGIDENPTSAYNNMVVARFDFTQLYHTFEEAEICTFCPPNTASTTLVIANKTAQQINVVYTIRFQIAQESWIYQGPAIIAPNATYAVGEINNKTLDITNGTLTVELDNVNYN